jgi:hypothetical protein
MKRELKKLQKLYRLREEGKLPYVEYDIIDKYFGYDYSDLIIWFEDYLTPILEKSNSEQLEFLGNLLYRLSKRKRDFREDYRLMNYLQEEFGWELIELLNRLDRWQIRLLGAYLVYLSDEPLAWDMLIVKLKKLY